VIFALSNDISHGLGRRRFEWGGEATALDAAATREASDAATFARERSIDWRYVLPERLAFIMVRSGFALGLGCNSRSGRSEQWQYCSVSRRKKRAFFARDESAPSCG